MLANFFGKSKPVNFILILVLFLIYYILGFSVLNKPADLAGSFIDLLIVFPFFLVLFFLFSFLVSKNRLTKDNSYAMLLFIISIGCLQSVILDYKLIGISILLFFFLRKVYSFRTYKAVYQKLFDSGFCLGILFLISPFFLLFSMLLYSSVFLFLKITIRTILIPVLGMFTPLFLYYTYLFWIDDVATFYELFDFVIVFDSSFYSSTFYTILLSVFGFFTFISIILRSGKVFSISNKFKRSWALLLTHLAVAIAFVLMMKDKNGSELIFVFVPVTIIISNWLQTVEKKGFVNVVLVFFLALSFAIHFII
jgi:hypothetical protein